MRLRAGGLTAIERLRGERNREYEQTAGGYMQTTFRKCADSGISKGDETDRLRTYSSGVTAIESKGSRSERLRG